MGVGSDYFGQLRNAAGDYTIRKQPVEFGEPAAQPGRRPEPAGFAAGQAEPVLQRECIPAGESGPDRLDSAIPFQLSRACAGERRRDPDEEFLPHGTQVRAIAARGLQPQEQPAMGTA